MLADRNEAASAGDALATLLSLSAASVSPVDVTRHGEWLTATQGRPKVTDRNCSGGKEIGR